MDFRNHYITGKKSYSQILTDSKIFHLLAKFYKTMYGIYIGTGTYIKDFSCELLHKVTTSCFIETMHKSPSKYAHEKRACM